MTPLVQGIRIFRPPVSFGMRGLTRRTLVIAAVTVAVTLVVQGWEIALGAMSEAFLAVTVFVAGTLALVNYAERGLKIDLGVWLDQHKQWQVPAATLLGAFPGCGGAIIAVTQYTRGYLSFGAVVATLITTMGDAIFLLLAREPQTAIGVLAVSVVVGIISGTVVDRMHGENYLRPCIKRGLESSNQAVQPPTTQRMGIAEYLWLALIVPGSVVGVLGAFQIEVDKFFVSATGVELAYWLGAAGAILALSMWATTGESGAACNSDDGVCVPTQQTPLRQTITTTNFVTSWVIFAFVGYELLVAAGGISLESFFLVWAPLVPAMAVLVGFIPGCGPQILLTSLYLSGSVPLSAQMGNAIANDGDALFPALVIAPKAALVATLYSAIPAVIVAYAWFFWAEGGAL